MRDFKILCDSACDLPDEILQAHDINIISFYTSIDGENYLRERLEISNQEFYKNLRDKKNIFPKTSFPAMQEFELFFRKYLDQEQDILYISLSSGLSGSFSAASNIAQKLLEKYQDANIFILDSLGASVCEGLLALQAVKAKRAGKNIFEIRDLIEQNKLNTKIFATVDSLAHLQRGGRIGKVSALAGSILNIKPIISLEDGVLVPAGKVRGRKRSSEKILELMFEKINNEKYKYEFCVFDCDAKQEAQELINILEKNYELKINLPACSIGPTIGSHIGPGALAIAAVKNFLL